MKFVVMVTEPRRRGLLEEKLQHILNSKNDVLLNKKLPSQLRPKPSTCPSKTPKNVITECTMCNEELTSNHVCREYLERLQPHAHYSTVPKGGGDITLTQTQKNFGALGSSIYEDDEQTLFSFTNGQDTGATIDVATKTEYEESNVDDIQVSLRPEKNHMLQIDHAETKNTFPTSWLNTIYSKDTFFYEPVILPQNCQRVNGHYYYPSFFTKEMKTITSVVDDENSVEQHTNTHHETHTYFTPVPPKFVRSVKRIKRDTYSYDSPQKKSAAVKRDKKKLIYPTNYSSSGLNTSITRNQNSAHLTRHSATGVDPPKKKRKYVRRTTKEEQIENGTALWQFLMRKLEDSECKSWIRWTGNDLEFKVLDQKEAAKQWGICKNRSKMTFDKFSRSMRFYYSKGILVHNPEKRLTYIFCRQPHDPVYTEMLERVMRTLPPNTIHCTATCLDPSHDHEKIKLNVRRRPKKISPSLPIPIKSKSLSAEEEDVDLLDAACRSVGVDNNSRGFSNNVLTDISYNSNNYPESQESELPSVSLIDGDYYNSNTFYGSSSMAALIAAASQAVPVPHSNVSVSYTKSDTLCPNRSKGKPTSGREGGGGMKPLSQSPAPPPYLRAAVGGGICEYASSDNDPYSEPMEFSNASYTTPTTTTPSATTPILPHPSPPVYGDTPAVVLGGGNRFSEADKKHRPAEGGGLSKMPDKPHLHNSKKSDVIIQIVSKIDPTNSPTESTAMDIGVADSNSTVSKGDETTVDFGSENKDSNTIHDNSNPLNNNNNTDIKTVIHEKSNVIDDVTSVVKNVKHDDISNT